MISCALGGGGLVRGHRVARPGRTATVWARQYPDGGRSRAPRVDVPNRASRNHPYPCTRATAAASSRGRRCAQKNVLTTRIVQDLRRGKLPSAGDYGAITAGPGSSYSSTNPSVLCPACGRRARPSTKATTSTYAPAPAAHVYECGAHGAAGTRYGGCASGRAAERGGGGYPSLIGKRAYQRCRGGVADPRRRGSPHPRAALQHRVCTRVTAATMCIRVNHVIQNACTSMRRVWLIVQFDRSDMAASVRQGQQWFACRAYWPCACARRRR